MKNTICITINLAILPLPIRNKIVTKVQQSKKRFTLENQEIKIDVETLILITPILNEL